MSQSMCYGVRCGGRGVGVGGANAYAHMCVCLGCENGSSAGLQKEMNYVTMAAGLNYC